MMTITPSTRGLIYWGTMPLPHKAICMGIVDRGNGDIGAYIEMPTGIAVQGNAGTMRSLPQDQVRAALAAARDKMGA